MVVVVPPPRYTTTGSEASGSATTGSSVRRARGGEMEDLVERALLDQEVVEVAAGSHRWASRTLGATVARLLGLEAPGYDASMTTPDRKPDAKPDDKPEAEPSTRAEAHRSAKQLARSRWVRRLADALLIAGGLLLSYPFWSAGYAQVQQARLDSAYRDQSSAFAGIASANADTREHGVPPRELVRRLAVLFGRQLKPGDPIGHLKIPRIGFNRLVQQGVSGKAGLDPSGDRDLLRGGPVHYGMTPLPGAGEPFAVAGHRTTYGAPFNRLDRLRAGDPIFLDTPYARFRYAVVKTTVVKPSDVSVLYDRGYGLILTTCTPLYSASHRLIVWGRLVKRVPLGQGTRSGSR